MKMRKNTTKIIAMTLAVSILIVNTNICYAADGTDITKQFVEEAADTMEDVTGIDNINNDIYSDKDNVVIADGEEVMISVPVNGDDAVVMDDGEGCDIAMYLPEDVMDDEGILTKEGTIIYGEEQDSVVVGVQPLQEKVEGSDGMVFEGVRTLISINDCTASKEYEFTYDLPKGYSMVTALEYLGEDCDTGEVFIIDTDNNIVTIIDSAWAKDANGDDIETYYRVEGSTLIQVVDFDENSAFPIVADPSVWQITKCVAALTWVIGSTVIAAAKVAKICKYVKALGGVRTTAKLLMGALVAKDVLVAAKAVSASLLYLCEVILGIDTIITNCKF